jgi:hypothetical protein
VYRYVLKQLKRSIVSTVAFCLLLVLAGTLMALGAGLLLSALRNARDIDSQFTTIALPDASAIRRFALNQMEGQNLQEYDTGHFVLRRDDLLWGGAMFEQRAADFMQDNSLNTIETLIYRSDVVEMDARRYFGAYSPDITALHNTRDSWVSGSAGGSAAFVAQVAQIRERYQLNVHTDRETHVQSFIISVLVDVVFEVEEVISLHPNISEPSRFYTTIHTQDARGGNHFSLGGRYFISGEYRASAGLISSGNNFIPMPNLAIDYSMFWPADDVIAYTIASIDDIDADVWADLTSIRFFATPTAADFPLPVTARRVMEERENTFWFPLGDKTFDEAMASGLGASLAFAVETVEMDSHRLNILTTGNLDSQFHFNQNRANITEGRTFTLEEYQSGARAAVIPRQLAQLNNLAVGDVISLTLFDGHFRMVSHFHPDNPQRSLRRWLPAGFDRTMPVADGPLDFEIIGIYTAPAAQEADLHSIPMNTIFIPDNAFEGFFIEIDGELFPHRLGFTFADNPLLNVIIVPNGRNEEFRQTINTLIPGYGAFFRLYDQGYSIVRDALDNLLRNGWFIFALCLAGWLIALLVFCLFYVSRKKKEAGLLYALGISAKHRFRWVFVQCVIVIIVAQGTAFVVADQLFDRVFSYAVEASVTDTPEATLFGNAAAVADGMRKDMDFERQPLAVPLVIILCMFILLAVSGVMARVIAKSDPRILRGAAE